MPQLADYLSILGLNVSSSTVDLKAAYRREISIWHPDRFHGDAANQLAATERAKKINAAYEHLSELHEIGSLPSFTNRNDAEGSARPSARPQTYRTQHTYRQKSFSPGFPDPSVFEVFVRSSYIISTGYSRRDQTLYVKLERGIVYSYFLVPESVFTAFLAASSHGKFANRYIFNQYRYASHRAEV